MYINQLKNTFSYKMSDIEHPLYNVGQNHRY